MKFSVLMSIYNKEKTEYFNRAMQSIWYEQSVKPDEIVLVQDGPLSQKLLKTIRIWKENIGDIFIILALEKNVGLGDALNAGIEKCSYNLVARMDTDDIALPDRFEKQINLFKKSSIDICGSWVSEFDQDESEIISYRRVPETNENILKFSRTRSPMNHPSVMYKKSAVIASDGYKEIMWLEDYYLWARMIMNGARFYNIQEPLVHMRVGAGQLVRRSGLKYANEELAFQKELLHIGFLKRWQFVRNIIIRIPVRLLPKKLLKISYVIIRKI